MKVFERVQTGTVWMVLNFFPVLGAVFLLSAIVAGFHSIPLGLPSLVHWDAGVAAAACAGFATTAVIFFTLSQFARVTAEASSARRLSAAQRAIQQAHDIQETESPSRRIAWVNAARLLLRAEQLSNELSVKAHKTEWNLFREEWRIRLLKFFKAPPRYYFGLDALEPHASDLKITEEDIKQIALDMDDVRTFQIGGYSSTVFADTRLSDRSIRAVFRFVANYDPDDDPLQSLEDDQELFRENVEFQNLHGLHAFIKISENYDLSHGRASKKNATPAD